MKKVFFLIPVIIFIAGLSAESLWKNKDLYSGTDIQPGQTVLIFFDSKRLIEYTTFQETYESSDLNNPYKSQMALDFLPEIGGDTRNRSTRKGTSKDSEKIQFSIMAKVDSVQTNGLLAVSGSHNMIINNQKETIIIRGLLDPARIRDGQVPSSEVNDLSLEYKRTILKEEMLTENDLTNSASWSNLEPDNAKKRELLLRYFNQILPLLFSE